MSRNISLFKSHPPLQPFKNVSTIFTHEPHKCRQQDGFGARALDVNLPCKQGLDLNWGKDQRTSGHHTSMQVACGFYAQREGKHLSVASEGPAAHSSGSFSKGKGQSLARHCRFGLQSADQTRCSPATPDHLTPQQAFPHPGERLYRACCPLDALCTPSWQARAPEASTRTRGAYPFLTAPTRRLDPRLVLGVGPGSGSEKCCAPFTRLLPECVRPLPPSSVTPE